MEYLETKKRILELKLKLVTVELEKQVIIRQQQYEKAADFRDQERELKDELDEVKEDLLQKLEEQKIAPASMEETYHLLHLLSEFNHDETQKTFATIRNSFMERLKLEYEELWNERKKLLREFCSADAHHLVDEIMEIGRFLVRYGSSRE
ncbi:MAG: UvrB/UvrC motif-containing protein [Flavobacteriia bacterium]|jgi:hypothetical protein